MEIRQFVTESLGDASYLVASDGVAAVVDPQRDVRPYLEAAAELGVRIEFVVETHVHNDYVSGGRELAVLGAEVCVPADAGIEFPHRELADRDEVQVGRARLRAVRAPGHTHHHTAYLAIDEDGRTLGCFTGGSIIIGGAGRTDLLGPEHTEALTAQQFESAQRIAALLTDTAEVLPTHGAGSFCSSSPGVTERRAPLEVERTRNPVLTSPDAASFAAIQLASPGPIPAYYRHMAPINRRGPRVYGTPPEPDALTPERLEAVRAGGAYVVDVRSRFAFARAHVPSSLSIEEGDATLAYVSWLTPFDAELVLVSLDAEQAQRLTVDLLRIGYERVRGFVPFEEWAAARPTASLDTATAAEVARRHAVRDVPLFDVRFDYEQQEVALDGATHRPLDRLDEWLPAEPLERMLVSCASGSRAATVGSALLAAGRAPLVLIDGGAADLASATPA
ncbi:MAG: MBL fold metallo-hydrolase [Dehalococcoidia bacterium]